MARTKAQIWSLDLIFALVIFGFTMTILAAAWLKTTNDISVSSSGTAAVLSVQTKLFADALMSPGYPQDWYGTIDTVNATTWAGVVPGILSGSGSDAIAPYKLYSLISLSNSNYSASVSLFGVGYNYCIQITGAAADGGTNITIGKNPLANGATYVYAVQRGATLYGIPVSVDIMLWTNTTSGAG
jgi:hypothetical protein